MTVLRVNGDIFQVFPNVVLGVVVARAIDNTGEHPDITAALRQAEAQALERFANIPINDHPHIAPWREAYRKFGAKPKENPSSIENLVRRVIKGHTLAHINRLVDIYNTISLRHLIPVGGEDLDKIEGDVSLTFATEHETPVRLLGEAEERPPRAGEVIYKDATSAICRRWNWKEADRTKFTESTRNAFLVIEGLPPVDQSLVGQAIDDLAALVQKYCGGTVTTSIVDADNPEILMVKSKT